MQNLFEIGDGLSYLIYPLDMQIILQQKRGSQFGRPHILSNDYKSNFSAIFYQNSLYYFYQNTDNNYLIKNMHSIEPLYQFPFSGEIHSIALARIHSELVLLYIEKTEESDANSFHLGYVCPFAPHIAAKNLFNFPSLPYFSCFTLEKGLFLFVKTNSSARFFVFGSDFSMQELHTDQELSLLYATIESAKSQYNDLMRVAEQYRDEAKKWRGKYVKE